MRSPAPCLPPMQTGAGTNITEQLFFETGCTGDHDRNESFATDVCVNYPGECLCPRRIAFPDSAGVAGSSRGGAAGRATTFAPLPCTTHPSRLAQLTPGQVLLESIVFSRRQTTSYLRGHVPHVGCWGHLPLAPNRYVRRVLPRTDVLSFSVQKEKRKKKKLMTCHQLESQTKPASTSHSPRNKDEIRHPRLSHCDGASPACSPETS